MSDLRAIQLTLEMPPDFPENVYVGESGLSAIVYLPDGRSYPGNVIGLQRGSPIGSTD